jgi:OHCU decarboxylase
VSEPAGLAALNRLDEEALGRELRRCCGSTAWVQGMLAARPFPTPFDLRDAADRIWQTLMPEDWLEAFAAHPRIGEPAPDRWSQQEQAGASTASSATLDALAEANKRYEARFGHIFIVCATNRSADELLKAARARIANDPQTELLIAAEEQRKITRLRLDNLLAELARRHGAGRR